MRARIRGALEGKLAHDRAALKAHEIVLEIEPSLIRSQSGAQSVVRRRQHTGTDAEAAAKVGRDGGEALARPQPSFVLSRPASVYMSVSASGEICRPRCSKSSPTLATTSRLSGFKIRLRPSASFAPPMPPDKATTRSRLIETDPHLRDE